MQAAGGRIIAIAELDAGIIDETGEGLDIGKIQTYHKENGTIIGYPGGQTVSPLI